MQALAAGEIVVRPTACPCARAGARWVDAKPNRSADHAASVTDQLGHVRHRTRLRPYLRSLVEDPARPGGARRRPEVIADLTAIAVSPPQRGTGTGRLLVDAFIRCCADAGVPRAELVTATGSAATAAFYERTGWTAREHQVTRDGLPVQRYERWTGVG